MSEGPRTEASLEIAAYVLQETAACDGDGGADASTLPFRIERRQGLTPGEDEVEAALVLLAERGLVLQVADRYVLTPLMRLRAPKDPDGAMAMSRQAWIRLVDSLGLTETG